MAEFDLKKANIAERGVIGGGAAVLVASLLPWYGTSGGGELGGLGNYNASASGWDAGFFGVVGILLCIAAAAWVAFRVFGSGKSPDLPLSDNALPLVLAGVGLALILLRLMTYKRASAFGFTVGPKIGVFLALIGAAVQAYFAYRAFQASGEKLAFDSSKMPKTAGASAPSPTGWAPPPTSGAAATPPSAPPAHDHDHGVDGHDHPHA